MNEQSLLDAILQHSTFLYTYNKILLDDAGNPYDYIFLDVNSAYADMIGVPREKIINRKVSEVLPRIGNDSFDWIMCYGNVALSGMKTEFEEYSQAVDRWFHISVLSPEYLYFVGISFDITDKKKTEAKLARSEELNRYYVENAPDGILITDDKARFLQANIAACRMFGYSEEELKNFTVHDLIVEEADREALDPFRYVKQNRKAQCTSLFRRKDGSLINVLWDAVMIRDGNYMSFCKDITAEINTRIEKDRYFNVFTSSTRPVMITDTEGKIIAVNDALVEMYGYTRGEMLNRPSDMLNPGIEEITQIMGYDKNQFRELCDTIWRRVKDPDCRKWEGVVINKKKDGSVIWVNMYVNGTFSARGKLTNLLCFPLDITQSREQENKNKIKFYQTLADLAELRDDDTGNHMKRVGIYARLIAREMKMNAQFCAEIELFAPMHDIGKVGILDSILKVPRRLTPEEFDVMKTHTVLGHTIVRGKPELDMAADITLYHHECFDGTGYPNGLSGMAIPVAAQITALCDVYDALRSRRPYKEPWTEEATIGYIVRASGSQFNPDVVKCFIKLERDFNDIYRTLLDPQES